jgi:polysaccharide biosynthesis protein PelB
MMNKRNHHRRLISPALLISIHLCLQGCASSQTQHAQSPPAAATTSAAKMGSSGITSSVQGTGTPPESAQNAPLLPGSPELELGYAELIREMGTPEEQQQMRDYLAGKSSDPAMRDFLISWYLERKDFESARKLITQARSDQTPVPAWQRLALAVEDNDRQAVRELLKESHDELTPSTQVDALQRVGLKQEALALAQQYLETIQTGPEAEQLELQADTLAISRASYAEVGGIYQKLGDLGIATGKTLLSVDNPLARITVGIEENHLDSSGNNLSTNGFDNEHDISVQATRNQASRQLALKLGTNIRDDKSIVYGQFTWDEYFSPRFSGRAELGINQISVATAYLRAVGTKDLLSLGATYNPDRWKYARGKIELHRYQTREDDRLGDGYLTEAALGRVILQELPRWLMEVRGSWEKNDLVNKVPSYLTPDVISPSTDIDTIIPKDYRTLGLASTLDYGTFGSDTPRSVKLMLDGWAGWLWPENKASYNIRLGLGTSVFSRDILSLDAYYANAFSGVGNQAYKGIGLNYRYYF